MRTFLIRQCYTCQHLFLTPKHVNNKTVYCSTQCKGSAQIRKFIRICCVCHNPFEILPSRTHWNKWKHIYFCSDDCRQLFQKLWQAPVVKLIFRCHTNRIKLLKACKYCGVMMVCTPCEISTRLYCSRRCQWTDPHGKNRTRLLLKNPFTDPVIREKIRQRNIGRKCPWTSEMNRRPDIIQKQDRKSVV